MGWLLGQTLLFFLTKNGPNFCRFCSINNEGIARRIPLLKVGYGIQLAAIAMAVNMAGNIYLNLKLFLSVVTTSLFLPLNLCGDEFEFEAFFSQEGALRLVQFIC